MSVPQLFSWGYVQSKVYRLNGLKRPQNYLFNRIMIDGKYIYFPYTMKGQIKESLVVA